MTALYKEIAWWNYFRHYGFTWWCWCLVLVPWLLWNPTKETNWYIITIVIAIIIITTTTKPERSSSPPSSHPRWRAFRSKPRFQSSRCLQEFTMKSKIGRERWQWDDDVTNVWQWSWYTYEVRVIAGKILLKELLNMIFMTMVLFWGRIFVNSPWSLVDLIYMMGWSFIITFDPDPLLSILV